MRSEVGSGVNMCEHTLALCNQFFTLASCNTWKSTVPTFMSILEQA